MLEPKLQASMLLLPRHIELSHRQCSMVEVQPTASSARFTFRFYHAAKISTSSERRQIHAATTSNSDECRTTHHTAFSDTNLGYTLNLDQYLSTRNTTSSSWHKTLKKLLHGQGLTLLSFAQRRSPASPQLHPNYLACGKGLIWSLSAGQIYNFSTSI